MNMSKSRDIQAKMPSPKVIYASNESKSVLARNLEECRDNDKNSQSVILSFKCILARNCEGTEQLRYFIFSISILLYFKKRCNQKQQNEKKCQKRIRHIAFSSALQITLFLIQLFSQIISYPGNGQ